MASLANEGDLSAFTDRNSNKGTHESRGRSIVHFKALSLLEEKAMREIEKRKQRRLDIEAKVFFHIDLFIKKQRESELKKQTEEANKKALKRKIEMIHIEHGVIPRNVFFKIMQKSCQSIIQLIM